MGFNCFTCAANEFAKREALDMPSSWPDLLDALYMGFNREMLAQTSKASHDTANDSLRTVTGALDVSLSTEHKYVLFSAIFLRSQWHNGSSFT